MTTRIGTYRVSTIRWSIYLARPNQRAGPKRDTTPHFYSSRPLSHSFLVPHVIVNNMRRCPKSRTPPRPNADVTYRRAATYAIISNSVTLPTDFFRIPKGTPSRETDGKPKAGKGGHKASNDGVFDVLCSCGWKPIWTQKHRFQSCTAFFFLDSLTFHSLGYEVFVSLRTCVGARVFANCRIRVRVGGDSRN